jgi:glycosyltransferase involved in cell wall biosynthesis
MSELLSVILPIYSEEKNINELYNRLRNVFTDVLHINYEIIFVDDGSNDDSWKLIEELHENDNKVIGLRFSRNFGHHIAITAGIDYSTGDYTLLMDSDLQDQPEEIPKLLDKLKEGYNVVYGIRQKNEF